MSDWLFPPWRNENGERKYPFTDGSTLRSYGGEATIPLGTFLDARIYVFGGTAVRYLSSVASLAGEITLTFSDGSVASKVTGVFAGTDTIYLVDLSGRPAGLVLVDVNKLQALAGDNATMLFDASSASLVASTVVPLPWKGVTAMLATEPTSGAFVPYSGAVWLVGGTGVILSAEDGFVRVDITGDAYYRRRQCAEGGAELSPPACFKTINNLAPDGQGNFLILPGLENTDNVIRIDPKTSGLIISLIGGKTL